MAGRTAYITTPIFYCNDVPHIGHAYTSTICDVWARFMRASGRDVFFLTGTDEHGVKVEKSAAAAGLSPLALADKNAAAFQAILATFNLTNDDFIRTTQPRHTRQVQAFVQRLIDSDDIFLGEYEGWYDEGQEEFIPENRAREQDLKSAVSGRPLVRMKEANYYFRLSKYQKPLEDLYESNPAFVRPDARRNEMLGRLREGLQDIPVSRTSFSWGIPVPGHEDHVLWVWIDALSNYITTLGLGEPDSPAYAARHHYWPATYHIIGKEILFFHAIFWPAMLMALNIPVPQCVYAHSFWISEGQKMSKSLGNFIDLATIQQYHDRYGLDAWRYYMATQGPLGATDADFAAAHFHDIYHTDLVNTVGNCASRVTAMLTKYFEGVVPEDRGSPDEGFDWPAFVGSAGVPPASDGSTSRDRQGAGTPEVRGLKSEVRGQKSDVRRAESAPAHPAPSTQHPAQTPGKVPAAFAAMESFDLSAAIRAALDIIRHVDAYINATEPFKLAKDDSPEARARLGDILYRCAEGVRIASLLLHPVMPRKMEDLWAALGIDTPSPSSGDKGEGRGEGQRSSSDAARTPRDRRPVDQTLATLTTWGRLRPGTRVTKLALFPRVEEPIEPAVRPGVTI